MSVHLPNMARKNFLQVASRLLLRLGSGCPPPREQLNSDDLRRMNLIWTKTKRDGRRSPRAYPLFQQQDTIIFIILLTWLGI